MIGEADERTKVHKLWFGLRKEIQHDLWRDRLNPEISSLRSVIASAEIIEIAQSVTGGGPEQKNKQKETQPVVRSAAMTPDGDRRHKRQERGRSKKKEHQKEPPKHQYQQPGPSQPKSERRDNYKRTEQKAGKVTKPKLSNEEQERHKAEGLCFVCHKPGHFSRNCPDRNKVPSASDKPPGVASFGIGVDFGDIEKQRELSTRSQDGDLTVSNINVLSEDDEIEDDSEPDNIPEVTSNDLGTESDISLSETDNETSTEEDSRSYNPWIGDLLGNRCESKCGFGSE